MKKLYSTLLDTGFGKDLSDPKRANKSRTSVQEIDDGIFLVQNLFISIDKGLSINRGLLFKRKTLYALGKIIAEIRDLQK